MSLILEFLCCLTLSAAPIDTRFEQVAPLPVDSAVERSSGQGRAVVLLHGLQVRPFSSRNVRQADFQGWQEPGSRLVEALAPHADVYAFAYSQNARHDAIAAESDLGRHVSELKQAGYAEIVLVGHSAGGLIARLFVEDQPDCGVTKVIQVCSPNGGSMFGKLKLAVRKSQECFLDSLTEESRTRLLDRRQGVRIPDEVEFACVVGQLDLDYAAEISLGTNRFQVSLAGTICGDGILSPASQWTEDLQQQGIPVYPLRAAHCTIMYTGCAARRLAELVAQPQPRWTPEEVDEARRTRLATNSVILLAK
jgi:pimeloyl-ACP methyl ester carboxylesterase